MSAGPGADALRARDAEARHAAQTDFDRPLILEAGAGTGKTSTLIARLLHWSLGPGWETAAERLQGERPDGTPSPEAIARRTLEGVQAITFTDAAAAEMTRRAGDALTALAGELAPPPGFDPSRLEMSAEALRHRAEALLGSLDHLTIQTFHSWSRGLLATWPLEAGIHPGFTIDADERLTEALSEEVLEASLIELYGADEGETGVAAPAVRLLALGVGPEELREALHGLVQAGVPSTELVDEAFTAERMRRPLTELAEAAREVAALLAPLTAIDNVTTVVRETHELAVWTVAWTVALREHPPSTPELAVEIQALRDRPESRRLEALRKWARHKLGSQWEKDHLPALQPRLSVACTRLAVLLQGFTRLDPERHELLRRVLAPLLAAVEAEKARRGVLTFDDLLDLALRLLRTHPAVASTLRGRSDQLMVDEFQDTDPRQCELVRCLALDGPVERRPGLFIVGDPKQSLYGWRQADLAAYGRFLDDVLAAGGTLHTLSVNFRSVPAILEEVSRTISPVMREEPSLQPRFHELLPSAAHLERDESRGDERPPVEYWTLWELEDGELATILADPAAEREAEEVARDLLDLHAAGAPWRDAAVLVRSRSRLHPVLEAFRATGIPFQVQGERSYFQRREIVEAQALLRTVLQPRDRLALVTLLRTAWVGVPDAALLPLLGGDLDELLARVTAAEAPELEPVERLVRRVAADLPSWIPGLAALAGWEENLLHMARTVGALRQSFRTETPDRFVAALRRLLLVDSTEAARSAGAFRCANLDRFFRQLESELEGDGDLADLLRFLRRSVESAREAPAAPPAETTEDAVQVMTIHGAKGLDFEHVYVLQADAAGRGTRDRFSARRPVDPEGRWALTLHATDNPERLLGALDEHRREGAERVRLLYVAMTRSRRRLVISGIWPHDRRPPADPLSARSFRELLECRPGLPDDFSELLRRGEGAPSIEEGGAWWRFLLPEAEPLAVPARAAATWIPIDADLARSFAEQVRRRADARAREALSPIARASDRGDLEEIDESTPPVATDDGDRALARVVGTEIHRLFEAWDPAADADAEYRRLHDDVLREVPPAARERARELLRSFRDGPLYERWRQLLPHLEARELPILLPRPPEWDGDVVGALVGAIDFVYRDPESGEPVLGDFKTDRIEPGETLSEHAQRYRSQADAYRRAVARALGVDALPRCELWFLDRGEVVPVPPRV